VRTQAQPISGARGEGQAWTPRRDAESTSLRFRARRESGQAAVEFAFVVPFLCLLILALVDFGKGVNYWLDANHLANEGARLAAVLGSSPEPDGNLKRWIQQQAETTELRNGTGSVTAPARVCIEYPNGTSQIGDPVRVTVSASYQWIPFSGAGTFHITGSSTMRLEQLPAYPGGCYPA
jgi:Flp pilus assembly protein TadG